MADLNYIRRYDLQQIEEMQKMIQIELKFVQSSTKPFTQEFNIDKELAWFDGVSSYRLDNFCSSLYDLTQKNH